jgi:hypothetical protein
MGEDAGEDGRPMRGNRWPEERRLMAAAAPRERLERRKMGVGGGVTEETLTPTA